ncbi:hypothetical protein [Maricaulis sp. MIT060901]|uniref:hypothetical protein n=1 Tax=Maricaulis sp. MIT060901 TaxID=3096993 RepID=UPI00399AAFD8
MSFSLDTAHCGENDQETALATNEDVIVGQAFLDEMTRDLIGLVTDLRPLVTGLRADLIQVHELELAHLDRGLPGEGLFEFLFEIGRHAADALLTDARRD